MSQHIFHVRLLIRLILFATLTGCVQATATSLPPVPISIPTDIQPNIVSTENSLAVNWETSKICVNEYPQQPKGNQLEGVAVLRSLSGTVLSLNLSLLDLKDGVSRNIDTTSQPVWDVGLSLDRKSLAYIWFNSATSTWELVVVDNVGSFQKVVWSSDQEFSFRGWLNDRQLVIVQDSKYIVIDPSQDTQLSFSPSNFPEFNLYHSDFYVTFDPLLSKAIYRNGKINVLDLITHTIIAHIEDGYDRIPIVSWRPMGEQVAVVSSIPTEQNLPSLPDEIFIVEKNGKIRQLTHLFDTFGLHLPINTLSWSPDGDKIAFWFPDKEANLTLMVADYATGDVVNYCILNVFNAQFPVDISAPIWSPDGKYLMVENRYSVDKNKILVIDLSNNVAFPIAENANPIGWMLK